jgi:cell division protein FtsZ
MAATHAATSPLLETSINGAKRLLVNVTAGSDFSIGEAHEAMEYILQFTDAEDADIIMGHVMKETPDNEVQITLLAAGMEPGNEVSRGYGSNEVFAEETPGRGTEARAPKILEAPEPILPEELDLDIPSFLRRQKSPGQ